MAKTKEELVPGTQRFRATFLLDSPEGVGFTFSVEGDSPSAIDDATTLAKGFIEGGYKPYSRNGGGKLSTVSVAGKGGGGETETKQCPIHPSELLRARDGKFGKFFSHRLADDSGWCRGK